jgi:hypothetical protein
MSWVKKILMIKDREMNFTTYDLRVDQHPWFCIQQAKEICRLLQGTTSLPWDYRSVFVTVSPCRGRNTLEKKTYVLNERRLKPTVFLDKISLNKLRGEMSNEEWRECLEVFLNVVPNQGAEIS